MCKCLCRISPAPLMWAEDSRNWLQNFIQNFQTFFREAFGGSNNFFLQVEASIRTPEKFRRESASWSWRSIHRKFRIRSKIRKSYFKWCRFGTVKSRKFETYPQCVFFSVFVKVKFFAASRRIIQIILFSRFFEETAPQARKFLTLNRFS